jgi:hypothetical protein
VLLSLLLLQASAEAEGAVLPETLRELQALLLAPPAGLPEPAALQLALSPELLALTLLLALLSGEPESAA